jgi:phage tail-like protein
MAEFSVNPSRLDPYKQFKFRVRWDGQTISGIDRVSGLKRVTDVVQHRPGDRKSTFVLAPGITTFEPIVLERGRTHDTAFESWANKAFDPDGGPGAEMSLPDFRKDIQIDLLNEAGALVMSFFAFRCWPSEYVALSDLDASYAQSAKEILTLRHEGFSRDLGVSEPVELFLGQAKKSSAASRKLSRARRTTKSRKKSRRTK